MNPVKQFKTFRWYDAVSFTLNQLLAGDHADHYKNLHYGTAERQKLDLYVPYHPRDDRALVIFVHGGSWQRGEKEHYVFLAQSLAKLGLYVATLNYQFAPENKFPVFADDVTTAVNWLQSQTVSESYGHAMDQVVLMGHSAGAFNIMSALYPTQYQKPIVHLDGIKAVIGIAGPYSFEHRGDPIAQYAFSQTAAPNEIMPSFYVYQNQIQHLLLMASKDTLVKDENTYQMQAALQRIGNNVEIAHIARTNHISIIATLAKGIAKFYPTRRKVAEFIDIALKDGQ